MSPNEKFTINWGDTAQFTYIPESNSGVLTTEGQSISYNFDKDPGFLFSVRKKLLATGLYGQDERRMLERLGRNTMMMPESTRMMMPDYNSTRMMNSRMSMDNDTMNDDNAMEDNAVYDNVNRINSFYKQKPMRQSKFLDDTGEMYGDKPYRAIFMGGEVFAVETPEGWNQLENK